MQYVVDNTQHCSYPTARGRQIPLPDSGWLAAVVASQTQVGGGLCLSLDAGSADIAGLGSKHPAQVGGGEFESQMWGGGVCSPGLRPTRAST